MDNGDISSISMQKYEKKPTYNKLGSLKFVKVLF